RARLGNTRDRGSATEPHRQGAVRRGLQRERGYIAVHHRPSAAHTRMLVSKKILTLIQVCSRPRLLAKAAFRFRTQLPQSRPGALGAIVMCGEICQIVAKPKLSPWSCVPLRDDVR